MISCRSRLLFVSIAIILLTLVVRPAHAQESALLRLDPAIQVDAVDADKSRAVLPMGSMDKRVVSLAPGTHVLEVCYDASSTSSAGTYIIYTTVKCDTPKQVTIDARAGRIYRLKLDLASPWRSWIEDVTAAESALVANEPKHKGEGKSILLVRISPANGRIGLANARLKTSPRW